MLPWHLPDALPGSIPARDPARRSRTILRVYRPADRSDVPRRLWAGSPPPTDLRFPPTPYPVSCNPHRHVCSRGSVIKPHPSNTVRQRCPGLVAETVPSTLSTNRCFQSSWASWIEVHSLAVSTSGGDSLPFGLGSGAAEIREAAESQTAARKATVPNTGSVFIGEACANDLKGCIISS